MQYDRARWVKAMEGRLSKMDVKLRREAKLDDMRHIMGIEKVLAWCESKGLSVDWVKSGGGSYDHAEKMITVSSRSTPRVQLQVLLHECGHHLIGRPRAGQRYSMGYVNTDTRSMKSDAHKIDILDEEFEAWERGWKLARRLGALRVEDRLEYNRYRVRMLKSYVNWAAESWA